MTELTAAQLGRDLGLIEEQVGELHEHIVGYFRARYHGEAYSAVGEQGEAASDDAPGDEAGDAAFSRLMDQGFEEVNAAVVADLRRRMPQMLAERRAARVGFDAHLYARWQRAIDLYEAILTLAQEAGDAFNQRHRPQAARNNDMLFDALVRLHARACLVASEVLALLSSGHASGANARWRTLHELAAMAYFIREHGEDTAERYLLHPAIESMKAAKEYQKHFTRLDYEPYSPEELAAFEADAAALEQRFGPGYSNHYGWAAKALGMRNPKFEDIEEAVALRHWRPFYATASHAIHAKPKAIAFDLGNLLPDALILAGPSNAGLADPGRSALISLFQVTTVVLGLRPDVREVMDMRAIEQLLGEAEDAFLAIQRQIEEEERTGDAWHDAEAMTPAELDAIRSRWDESGQGTSPAESGYALAHAPADLRRLLAEIARLRELAGEE